WNFWTRPVHDDEDDVVKREWVFADCAGAATGAQVGGLFGPWTGLAGAVIGGAAASLAVR
ncbi:MAG TPA: hypothetical protein DEB46_09695, partial [Myxococcales bacterium]|nr:hypothetical protein [Myxococcales bacterium]